MCICVDVRSYSQLRSYLYKMHSLTHLAAYKIKSCSGFYTVSNNYLATLVRIVITVLTIIITDQMWYIVYICMFSLVVYI